MQLFYLNDIPDPASFHEYLPASPRSSMKMKKQE